MEIFFLAGQNLEIVGFWLTNWVAFLMFCWKKKRTPIRHLKSKKVFFFAQYEEKKNSPGNMSW